MPSTIVEFHHPKLKEKTISVETGMDEIGWAYRLNTANFPTYGGEVVQILSVLIDNLLISGTCHSYEQMQKIYHFFAEYIMIASQGEIGGTNKNRYVQTPMTMRYPERQWSVPIQPISVPGFKYSTETVAPVWHMEAHVVDDFPNKHELEHLVVTTLIDKKARFELEGIISMAAGEPEKNPFMSPGVGEGKHYEPIKTGKEEIDVYHKMIEQYQKGNFKSLVGSGPALGRSSEEG